MAYRRLDTGPVQRQRQAVAPQPDRDFPQPMQPQTMAQLTTGKVIPGNFEPTAGMTQPPAPQGNVQGSVRPQQGLNFGQLENRYQNLLDNGRGGQQFLQNHPKFADRINNGMTYERQGPPMAATGTNPAANPRAQGPVAQAPPPTNIAGVDLYDAPPPGSYYDETGRLRLPVGWAQIGGDVGKPVKYVQGWNQLTNEQRQALMLPANYGVVYGQDNVMAHFNNDAVAASNYANEMAGYTPEQLAEWANETPGQPAAQPMGGAPVDLTGNPFAPVPGQQPLAYGPPVGDQRMGQPAQGGTLTEGVTTLRGQDNGGRGPIRGEVGGSLPAPGQGQAPAPTPAPNPAPNPGASTLTLSPAAEAARRGLEDELAATLASIGVARDQIPATLNLITTRLMNDQTEDLRNTDEAANARGIYNSGIRSTDRGRVTQDYDRKRADIAADAARQLSELASAESAAYAGFNRSWADVLLDLARAASEDPNYGVGSSTGDTYGNTGASQGKGPKPKPQGKNRRNNNRNKKKRDKR